MKILAIGDPHGDLQKVQAIPLQGVDLILLTGDLGSANLMRAMAFENAARLKNGLPAKEYSARKKKRAFMEAYSSSLKVMRYLARHAPVYTIYGNVESSNAETRRYSKELGLSLPFLSDALRAMKDVYIINNKLVRFKGVRIGGLAYFVDASWVREFRPGEYRERMKKAKKESERATRTLQKFGNVDLLVCHQPPYGVLDKVTAPFAPAHWKGKHAGSKVIRTYIEKKQPRYVFCGHIHEGEGKKKLGRTQVYNLGVCGYQIIPF